VAEKSDSVYITWIRLSRTEWNVLLYQL